MFTKHAYITLRLVNVIEKIDDLTYYTRKGHSSQQITLLTIDKTPTLFRGNLQYQ